jgi:hypothetical protein
MGALTGAMTSAPAMSLVNREANSSIPAHWVTPGTYAFANVLLTLMGTDPDVHLERVIHWRDGEYDEMDKRKLNPETVRSPWGRSRSRMNSPRSRSRPASNSASAT